MTDFLVKMEIASKSGLMRDKFSASFAVEDADMSGLGHNFSDLANAWSSFLNAVPSNGLASLSSMLSPEVEFNDGLSVKIYDVTGKLAGGPANPYGSPAAEFTGWDINGAVTPGSPGLPAEVACAVTLEGFGRDTSPVERPDGLDAGTEIDRPKQRRTGRFYLGPFNTLVLSSVGGQVRPGENLLDTARLAVQDLQDDVNAASGGNLAVWSRKDAAMYHVTAVSVDNAFDTIRSRGPGPTIRQRTLFT